MAPLSHFPPDHAGSEPKVRHHCFLRARPSAAHTRWRTAWSAGLRPASRGSAKPAPTTLRRTDVSGAPPAHSGLRCSLRFAQRCRPPPGELARGRRSLSRPRDSARVAMRRSLGFAQRCRSEAPTTGRTGRRSMSTWFCAGGDAWVAAVRLMGGGVVGAGFALTRDAGRRPPPGELASAPSPRGSARVVMRRSQR